MAKDRFKSDEFKAAVAEVAAGYLTGVTHIPSAEKLVELAAEATLAAMEAAEDQDDVVVSAKGLEHIPFTEFAKLSVLVPTKPTNNLKDYPLLSDNFLAEPFFQQYPTIAAVRGFLNERRMGFDDLKDVRYEGQTRGLRYDRREDIAQLIHRCGLELLPGMYPFMEMGKDSEAWDRENLRELLEQVASAQTRDMISHLLRDGEDDNKYLYATTPITRNQILTHLKAGDNDALLDNALVRRNAGPRVAAHLRFLLDFRWIGLRGRKPYLMPFQPNGRVRKPDMVSTIKL